MKYCLFLEQIKGEDLPSVGGKASALADLSRLGLRIPKAVCIKKHAYDEYLQSTGLGEQIYLELNRKSFAAMRWEELWDISLRIRNLFLRAPLPDFLEAEIQKALKLFSEGRAFCVRSSAPGEDSRNRSFAGLHESYVNISGLPEVLKHIRLVWASLWSDRALLYRRELGLDAMRSSMSVLVQELVNGQASGVVFGRGPVDADSVVIEAVHGLNQGLVDGSVEPDRWIVNASTGQVSSHKSPVREKVMRPSFQGAILMPLEAELANEPPLAPEQVKEVFELAGLLGHSFGMPQDTEWTYVKEKLVVLQSRPITTLAKGDEDQERLRYLGLTRSLENLKFLRAEINDRLLPEMEQKAARMLSKDLSGLSEAELAKVIIDRQEAYSHYKDQYWEYCIPFAHGMRLFAQVYNDLLAPTDPYEFMDLLSGEKLISTARNQRLAELASYLRGKPFLQKKIQQGKPLSDHDFEQRIRNFVTDYGGGGWSEKALDLDAKRLSSLIYQMSLKPETERTKPQTIRKEREEEFLNAFGKERHSQAKELLDLARDSYSLRDNDNIYLGKLEGLMLAAMDSGRQRLSLKTGLKASSIPDSELVKGLKGVKIRLPKAETQVDVQEKTSGFAGRARQLVGQPAGPGLAVGRARVLLHPADLFEFQAGEVLVADAVDPNMTFVAPLAVAVVERRGGMLIHGAIIAREYGLPCITGVTRATELIKTGDLLTVDGHLGLVIVGEPSFRN